MCVVTNSLIRLNRFPALSPNSVLRRRQRVRLLSTWINFRYESLRPRGTALPYWQADNTLQLIATYLTTDVMTALDSAMRSTQQMRARLQRSLWTRLIEIDIFIEFESCMRFIMVVVTVGGGGVKKRIWVILGPDTALCRCMQWRHSETSARRP